MDGLQRLIAIEELKQLKARYFRGVDTKDAALLRSVFADDATADYRGAATDPRSGVNAIPGNTEQVVVGAEAIVSGIMQSVIGLTTVHHGHLSEFEVLSDTEATGIIPMVDRLTMPEGSPIASLDGWGHYHETYRKEGGRWKIATLKLTRLRVDVVTRD